MGPVPTHEYVAQDQLPLGVQATIELHKQRAVFMDPVRVKNIGDKYGVESAWKCAP